MDGEGDVVNRLDHPGGTAVQQPRPDDKLLDGVPRLDDYIASNGVGLHIHSKVSTIRGGYAEKAN